MKIGHLKTGIEKCLISPWGQSWERVLLKHKCILSIARVPKARVLLIVCTSAWAKPFPKIVPMVKLHSLVVATSKKSDFVFLKKLQHLFHLLWCKGFVQRFLPLVVKSFAHSISSIMVQSFCAKLFATSGKNLCTKPFHHGG